MGAVFSIDQCHNSLLRSSQRANELTAWRSRDNPNRGVLTKEAVFSVLWPLLRLYNASTVVANLDSLRLEIMLENSVVVGQKLLDEEEFEVGL
jgi:hypothetical protein